MLTLRRSSGGSGGGGGGSGCSGGGRGYSVGSFGSWRDICFGHVDPSQFNFTYL